MDGWKAKRRTQRGVAQPMAWEDRKGKSYYYTKEREGSKVVSRYVGSGEVAQLIGQFSALRREEDRERRAEIAAERNAMLAADRAVDDVMSLANELMQEALQAEGFHQHDRGEWRKKRDGKGEAKNKTKD
jgi:hypothetical protein